MIIPPLNITIWATANDYTWFPICIMYMSDNAIVYQNRRKGSDRSDIAINYSFKQAFRGWKLMLDGTEKQVSS